jgi:hypothetical protein
MSAQPHHRMMPAVAFAEDDAWHHVLEFLDAQHFKHHRMVLGTTAAAKGVQAKSATPKVDAAKGRS